MRKRIVAVVGAAFVGVVATAGLAMAAVDSTAQQAVTDGATTLKDTLISIATTVLPYAAALLAITFGWRLAKKFVRG